MTKSSPSVGGGDRNSSEVAKLDLAMSLFKATVEEAEKTLSGTLIPDAEDKAYAHLKRGMETLLGSLSSAQQSANSDTGLDSLRDRFRATLGPTFDRSPLTRHAFVKPHGYPGDFQMLESIYEQDMAPAGLPRLFDRYFLDCHAATAVNLRRQLVAKRLKERLGSSPPRKRRIMSVGCGPVRELLDISSEPGMDGAELVLVDVNEAALDFARERLVQLQRRGGERYVLADVKGLARGDSEIADECTPQSFDFIYSMGVMDYLRDPALTASIIRLYSALRSDGVCLIGNFDPRNPSRTYMEWVGNWRLIYRSAEQLTEIAVSAGVPRDRIRVITETGTDAGINNILELSAPTESDLHAIEQERTILRGMSDAALIGGVLYPFWAIIDWFQLKSLESHAHLLAGEFSRRFFLCLFVRGLVTVITFVFVFLAPRVDDNPAERRWLRAFGTAVHLLIGLGIVAITWVVGGPATNYFAGLILVFIGITVLVPIGWKYIASQLGVLVFSYVAMAVAWGAGHSAIVPESYSNMVFLVGAAVVCAWGAYKAQMAHSHREDRRGAAAVQRSIASTDERALDRVVQLGLAIITAIITGIIPALFGK